MKSIILFIAMFSTSAFAYTKAEVCEAWAELSEMSAAADRAGLDVFDYVNIDKFPEELREGFITVMLAAKNSKLHPKVVRSTVLTQCKKAISK